MKMNISKCEQEYGFRVYKTVLIYTVVCSIVSTVFSIYCSAICIVIIIIMYHNVLITSYQQNGTFKVKSSEIIELLSVYCFLVRCSKYVNFSKIHI